MSVSPTRKEISFRLEWGEGPNQRTTQKLRVFPPQQQYSMLDALALALASTDGRGHRDSPGCSVRASPKKSHYIQHHLRRILLSRIVYLQLYHPPRFISLSPSRNIPRSLRSTNPCCIRVLALGVQVHNRIRLEVFESCAGSRSEALS